MTEQLNKDNFILFIFYQILFKQAELLIYMQYNQVLNPLLSTSEEKEIFFKVVDKISHSAELLQDENYDGHVSLEHIIPYPPVSWPLKYHGTINEKIKTLLLEVQVFSIFPFYSLLGKTFRDTDIYFEMVDNLFQLFYAKHKAFYWTSQELIQLQHFWKERLSQYHKAFFTAKSGGDLFKFAALANKNILKQKNIDVIFSSFLLENTSATILSWGEYFKKHKE